MISFEGCKGQIFNTTYSVAGDFIPSTLKSVRSIGFCKVEERRKKVVVLDTNLNGVFEITEKGVTFNGIKNNGVLALQVEFCAQNNFRAYGKFRVNNEFIIEDACVTLIKKKLLIRGSLYQNDVCVLKEQCSLVFNNDDCWIYRNQKKPQK